MISTKTTSLENKILVDKTLEELVLENKRKQLTINLMTKYINKLEQKQKIYIKLNDFLFSADELKETELITEIDNFIVELSIRTWS